MAEVEHTAEAYGIAVDVDWDCIQVPLVGDEELSEAVAVDVPSYGALKPIHPSMAGEDFVEFSGCGRLVFAFIGSNGGTGVRRLAQSALRRRGRRDQAAVDFYVNASLRVLAELR